MGAKRKQRLTPRTARTLDDVLALPRDNVVLTEGWAMLLEGENAVLLCQQPAGESSTGKVTFSRRTFNRIVDWYNGRTD